MVESANISKATGKKWCKAGRVRFNIKKLLVIDNFVIKTGTEMNV